MSGSWTGNANVDGNARRMIELRDLLVVLDAAAKDKNIGSVYLMLDDVQAKLSRKVRA